MQPKYVRRNVKDDALHIPLWTGQRTGRGPYDRIRRNGRRPDADRTWALPVWALPPHCRVPTRHCSKTMTGRRTESGGAGAQKAIVSVVTQLPKKVGTGHQSHDSEFNSINKLPPPPNCRIATMEA
eukprot:gene12039-biopygen381